LTLRVEDERDEEAQEPVPEADAGGDVKTSLLTKKETFADLKVFGERAA
jgi:hypothetical protein